MDCGDRSPLWLHDDKAQSGSWFKMTLVLPVCRKSDVLPSHSKGFPISPTFNQTPFHGAPPRLWLLVLKTRCSQFEISEGVDSFTRQSRCVSGASLNRNDAVGMNGEHSRPGCYSARPRAKSERARHTKRFGDFRRENWVARARLTAPGAGAVPISTASFRLRPRKIYQGILEFQKRLSPVATSFCLFIRL